MKKTVRLTESDLERLVHRIISEQHRQRLFEYETPVISIGYDPSFLNGVIGTFKLENGVINVYDKNNKNILSLQK